MRGNGETLDRPDFKGIEKFFTNIDFLVPGHERSSQYMVAMHFQFYRWARDRVAGFRVLDAGCGEGYGCAIMAEKAAHVVGIDVKSELIAHARRRYALSSVEFEVMDCEAMSFGPASFDAVVCNELIEHLTNYRAFLREAHRILRPGGIFLCATTNAGITFTNPDGSPMNRNHFQEFTPESLRSELEGDYAEVRLFSECMRPLSEKYILNPRARSVEWLLVRLGIKHKIPIQWRNRIREGLTGIKVQDLISEGFEIVEGASPDCLYIISSARKHLNASHA